jgi:hypothetical protein
MQQPIFKIVMAHFAMVKFVALFKAAAGYLKMSFKATAIDTLWLSPRSESGMMQA